ncbi:hypothetical protein OUZ56_016494 [Daphnia magna]|uniref:Uncharacterized protein n=1 Tax=Daphnia magna TaxID=35525 RepID=A0ABR0AR35_9CRUS|nr:hypothetical protein OUZ56_016494 [Daphnia magna]
MADYCNDVIHEFLEDMGNLTDNFDDLSTGSDNELRAENRRAKKRRLIPFYRTRKDILICLKFKSPFGIRPQGSNSEPRTIDNEVEDHEGGHKAERTVGSDAREMPHSGAESAKIIILGFPTDPMLHTPLPNH